MATRNKSAHTPFSALTLAEVAPWLHELVHHDKRRQMVVNVIESLKKRLSILHQIEEGVRAVQDEWELLHVPNSRATTPEEAVERHEEQARLASKLLALNERFLVTIGTPSESRQAHIWATDSHIDAASEQLLIECDESKEELIELLVRTKRLLKGINQDEEGCLADLREIVTKGLDIQELIEVHGEDWRTHLSKYPTQ